MRDRKSDTAHRKVAEQKLGRKITDKEVVHHVDEDKANDTSANLAVEARGRHTAAHNRGRKVSALRASLRMHREGQKLY